ncbi:tetratricopeptide repeat protein [Sedimentitalea todarodis]|uniref:Tetratricopeptide repeat protein n=1 Tax=Sedimentitalea todarodis TaxID=1631240 RepID=A0ABU3VDS7_9RHOB|nr:tetratricopeptide repeat protein [Sedimentitalea todarodis]MDU9004314.1 tetratricopeptide repeat protein [Sedimentitalea todarodis]
MVSWFIGTGEWKVDIEVSSDETTFSKDALQNCLLVARNMLLPPNPVRSRENAARIAVAKCFQAIGESAQADALYAAVLEINPAHKKALRARVDAALAAGRAKKAISCIENALAVLPGDSDLESKLAILLRQMGQKAKKRSLAKNPPKPAKEILRKARDFFAIEEYIAAEENFRQLVAIDPKQPAGWTGQADVALATGQPSLAVTLCDRGLENVPGDETLVLRRASGLRRMGDTSKAVEFLSGFFARNPTSRKFKIALARSFAALGKTEDARAIYSEILRKSPGSRRALTGRADILLASGDLGAALAACEEALTHFPDDLDLSEKQARILVRAGRHQDALTMLHSLKQNTQAGPALDLQLAEVHLASGDPGTARELFQSVLAADPENNRAILGLAEIAEQSGEIEDTLEMLEQGLKAGS